MKFHKSIAMRKRNSARNLREAENGSFHSWDSSEKNTVQMTTWFQHKDTVGIEFSQCPVFSFYSFIYLLLNIINIHQISFMCKTLIHNFTGYTPFMVVIYSLSHVWLLWPHGLSPVRLHCLWDFPGKNTRVGSISFSRAFSWPRDWTQFCTAGRCFTDWATREAPFIKYWPYSLSCTVQYTCVTFLFDT